LNSGLRTCKAGPLRLELYLRSTLLRLFGDGDLENYLPGPALNRDPHLSLPSSGITGVSHPHLLSPSLKANTVNSSISNPKSVPLQMRVCVSISVLLLSLGRTCVSRAVALLKFIKC
jgi:hypothetical protein